MKTKKRQSNYYSVMFFPERAGKPFTLRVPRYTVYLLLISAVFVMVALGALVYVAGDISLKLQQVNNLTQENLRLREYRSDFEVSAEKLANIDSMTAYLRRLAGFVGVEDAAGALASPAAPQQIADRQERLAAVAAARIEDTPVGATVGPPARLVSGATTGASGATSASAGMTASGVAASVPSIMPVNGWITRYFADDPRPGTHRGIDIAAAHGTPIRSTAAGVVDDVRTDRYLGLMVEVRHEGGFLTRYAHCSQVLVTPGDRVNRGQTIALVGNTGRSTGPHLHYEVLKNGRYVDPMNFIGTVNANNN